MPRTAPASAGSGVVDLRDLAVAQHGLKFLGAEEADEAPRASRCGTDCTIFRSAIGVSRMFMPSPTPGPELTASAT